MYKILVTGFEPFDGLSINPSAQLLSHLSGEKFDFSLATKLLPVSFLAAFPVLEKQICSFKPDMVVMTGLAQNRIDITIEKIAVNYLNARNPDNDGLHPKKVKIVESGPDGIFCSLPWEEMLQWAEKERLPITGSFSAGTYVCNDLFYKAMLFCQKENIKAGFIHLPATEEVNPLGPFLPKRDLFHHFTNLLRFMAKT